MGQGEVLHNYSRINDQRLAVWGNMLTKSFGKQSTVNYYPDGFPNDRL